MIDIKKMRADLKAELREKIGGDSGDKYLKIIHGVQSRTALWISCHNDLFVKT